MHGILVINKPEVITSFDVVRRVRRVFGTRKVGHGGTLDPLATGVLPVAIGQGTRLLEYVTCGSKLYRAQLRFGEMTDTQDCQGVVLESRDISRLTPDDVYASLSGCVGLIEQVPPMYSALKHEGTPLYKLARQGQVIDRKPRQVTIEELVVETVQLPFATFRVRCSPGTYVRTLIHDFGVQLGVGAHMTRLCRLASEPFRIDEALEYSHLEQIGPGNLPDTGWYDLLQAVSRFPQVELLGDAQHRLDHGIPPLLAQVVIPPDLAEGEIVALIGNGQLRAMAIFAPEGCGDPRGDFVLKKVFHG